MDPAAMTMLSFFYILYFLYHLVSMMMMKMVPCKETHMLHTYILCL